MLCSKMNAELDAGPAQLCAVALSRICSSDPFDWQNKNIHSLQSQVLQNKTSESKKMRERATFLTLHRPERKNDRSNFDWNLCKELDAIYRVFVSLGLLVLDRQGFEINPHGAACQETRHGAG